MKQILKIFLVLLTFFLVNQHVLAAGDFGCKFTRAGCTPNFDTDTCDTTSQVDYNYCPQFTNQGAQACNNAPRKACIEVGSCSDLGGTCRVVTGPTGCGSSMESKGHLDCPGAGEVCCVPTESGGSGNIEDTLVKLDELIQGMGGKIPQMTDLGAIVSAALPLLFGITGFALFLFLIAAGFKYLTSSGDPKKLEAAKGSLTTAIIGFVLIFAAYWITQAVNYIFNLQAGF